MLAYVFYSWKHLNILLSASEHWQLSLWMKRCVRGHEKKKLHKQRNKTLKILEKHHMVLKKERPNLYLIIACFPPWHIVTSGKRWNTAELIDSDRLKVSLLLFESLMKNKYARWVNLCSKGNDTWIFFYLPPLKFWFWMWCFDIPAEMFDLIWSRALWSSALLGREMPPRSSTITANKPNFLTYIGMEQLSHILPLKNISLVLNTSWEKLSLWYVYTKLLE